MENELRFFWTKFFKPNWQFGLVLLLIVCSTRFVWVLQANQTKNYSSIGLVMLFSALVPFVFLNKQGLQKIGIKTTKRYQFLLLAFVLGFMASFVLHFIGKGLYGNSYENWYVYIGQSFNIAPNISPQDKKIMFIIMAIVGATFSPIGEEFFFRGIIHQSFANSFGNRKASIMDGLAFSITHISHFGIVFINNTWSFFLIPALIWTTSMFLISKLFFQMKQYSNSIWGAVFCHSGFNIGMTYSIFYLL